MTLGAVTFQLLSQPFSLEPIGGKEELRAACLKPYLLRLRALHDDEMVRALFATQGLPEILLEDENAWISVATARRALSVLESSLGEGSIEDQGAFITHPESLGAHVRMLRAVSRPIDAYRYIALHADRDTRVGSFDIEEAGPSAARITYLPDEDDDSEQDDPLFCKARIGAFRALPRLWGLPDAVVREAACIAHGDEACVYEISWQEPHPSKWTPLTVAAGCALSGAVAALVGSVVAIGLASMGGAALSLGISRTLDLRRKQQVCRTFEKHRITALERGLELREHALSTPGDLTGVVLGGKYRVVGRIGSGGSGAVYAAEHIALGSKVAVKVLRGPAARNASEIARLRREARVQVSLEHPNVVRTFDLDKMPDGSIYLVMELLRGESLAAKMARERVVSLDTAVPIFIQICRALSVAHDSGIVHRDMKPGNIFLCDNGTAKVLDFGMSKLSTAESLTREGHTLGTPEYMAPEQCIGAPIEPRTDVYALGVLMYEALSGELPIKAQNRRELLDLHQHAEPRSLREMAEESGIPAWLDEAVMKALAKSPEDRPTAAELELWLRRGLVSGVG